MEVVIVRSFSSAKMDCSMVRAVQIGRFQRKGSERGCLDHMQREEWRKDGRMGTRGAGTGYRCIGASAGQDRPTKNSPREI